MNRSLLIGLVAGAGAATALGAVANYALVTRAPDEGRAAVQGFVQRDPGAIASPADGPAVADRREAGTASAPARDGDPAQDRRVARSTPAVRDGAPASGRTYDATGTAPRRAPATFARVVDVEPVKASEPEARQVCRHEPVVQQAPVRDEHRVAGTLAGAVLGGILGHQIGGGDGRKIARVAGAVAGGYAGNRIQDRMQKADTVTTTERRCETVYEPRERTIAYDVTYSYEGRTRTVRMDRAPGERLPVRNGRVVTES